MSLISIFVDAFNKALGRKRKDDLDLARSSGGSLGSTPDTGAFDPLRPAPTPSPTRGVDTGGVTTGGVTTGNVSVASADPEEGGESPVVQPPRDDSPRE